ncbi:hypothetical protein [Saccharopolyspora cebuensis]|uniref:Uncharacterized protein n=1 Tax=Saccharopolyspora cebuensis TaxID=418759 RepID=A0ABV4CN33_9PSEU
MLGYRSVFQVDQRGRDVLGLTREQLHSWLRSKHYDADVLRANRVAMLAPHVEGVLLERSGADGSYAMQARITERTRGEPWVTQLTALVPRAPERAMLWLDVVNPEVFDEAEVAQRRQWTAAPRLVRNLLDVLGGTDGAAELGTRPRQVRGDEAKDLADVVRDAQRRGPVYVAGSTETLPQQRWFEHVAALLWQTVGLGAGYVLDPEATRTFARIAGRGHEVRPGTLRTFLPGAEFGDGTDALRHRLLSTGRIVDDAQPRLTRLLGWRARDVTIGNRLPRTALRLGAHFESRLDELVLDAEPAPVLVGAPAQAPGPAVPDLEVARLLREEFGGTEPTADALRELFALARIGREESAHRAAVSSRLAEIQERNAELQRSVDELNIRCDDETLAAAEARAELVGERRMTKHLRSLLTGSQLARAWSAPEPAAEDVPPESFDDLLPRIAELRHVEFTGDAGPALQLDEGDRLGRWAGKAWEALRALDDYASASAAGRCPRNVHGYLKHTPDGCQGFSANRHGFDESEDVRNNGKFSTVRMFPVPVEVDPSGQVFMGAHFKLVQSKMTSPRLHYFDDTARTGKVYVGYIGAHLPTKRTN